MKFKTVLFLWCVSFAFVVKAQNPSEKWVAGISTAFAGYQKVDASLVGGQIAYQTPRFSLAMYFKKNFIFEGAIATAIGDNQKYTTFDGTVRYDFGHSYDKLVPYVLVGGSFISAKRLTPTVNIGVGSTYWISSKFGFNAQIMYKFSQSQFESQRSHVYPSAGLVYSLGARSNNARLWER